jgi:hypothetical protein
MSFEDDPDWESGEEAKRRIESRTRRIAENISASGYSDQPISTGKKNELGISKEKQRTEHPDRSEFIRKYRISFLILLLSLVIGAIIFYAITIQTSPQLLFYYGIGLRLCILIFFIAIGFILYLSYQESRQESLALKDKKELSGFIKYQRQSQKFNLAFGGIVVTIMCIASLLLASGYINSRIDESTFIPIIKEKESTWMNYLSFPNVPKLTMNSPLKEKFIVWDSRTNGFLTTSLPGHSWAVPSDPSYTIFYIADVEDHTFFGTYQNMATHKLVQVYGPKYRILGINMPENQLIGAVVSSPPPSEFTVPENTEGEYTYNRFELSKWLITKT